MKVGGELALQAQRALRDERRNSDFILQTFKMALGVPLGTVKYTVIGSREGLRLHDFALLLFYFCM